MKLGPVGITILALIAPTASSACRSAEYVLAIVHSKLPRSMPDGMVAVEAVFPDGLTNGDFRRSGAEARILRVVRGEVPVRSVWVSPEDGGSSCSYAFANGRNGLLVGRLRNDGSRWVLAPEWVIQRHGFQLEGR